MLPAYLIGRLFLFIKRLPAPSQLLGQLLGGQLAPCLFLDERPVLFGPGLEGGAAHSTGRFLLRRRLLFFLLFSLRQEIRMFCFSISKQSILRNMCVWICYNMYVR
jgi:hypothetical protein